MLIIILTLAIILTILLILDLVTTEHVIQLGGTELNPDAMFFAGNPKKHVLVKILEILGIFIVIFLVDILVVILVDMFKEFSEIIYLIVPIILIIIFLILIIRYSKVVINNLKAIDELKRRALQHKR